tara:strand:+ start:390 stop:554 length:165 start_codon:yes stop_codon:yes gene_type:complete
MLNNKKQIKMTLDDLIKQTEDNIKYHLQRLAEEHTKLDAYFTARDAKADNPHSK